MREYIVNFEFVETYPENLRSAGGITPLEATEHSPFVLFVLEHDLVPVNDIPLIYRMYEHRKRDWIRTERFMYAIPHDWIEIEGEFGCYGVYQEPETLHVWAIYKKPDHYLAVLAGKGVIEEKKDGS